MCYFQYAVIFTQTVILDFPVHEAVRMCEGQHCSDGENRDNL